MYYSTNFKKTYLGIVSVFLVVLSVLAAGSCRKKVNAEIFERQIPVLMYHSVCVNRRVNSEYVLTPEKFRADMEYLIARGYKFVSFSEIYDYYTGKGSLPEKPVAVTFDDGFLNNLTVVLPVLEELNIKANINVVGSYTQKYSDITDRSESYACLTWDDVNTLKNSGLVEIGSHTWDMHDLGERRGCSKKRGETDEAYRAALDSDVKKLNAALSENCGITPSVFAYPYGETSEGAQEVLEANGFTVLLTCEEKINAVSCGGAGTLTLGRINRASSCSTEEFFDKLGM